MLSISSPHSTQAAFHTHTHTCAHTHTPLPRLSYNRTIAKALRVTKFDSVSTLLADYTGRNTAAATVPSMNPKAAKPSTVSSKAKRAVTAASGGGSRPAKARSGAFTAAAGVGRNFKAGSEINVDPNVPYPTGKLEDDKNPPLFASSVCGRKMVSIMVDGGNKGGGNDARRFKTAASRGVGVKGSALKGLAIRDLTPPGFQSPAARDVSGPTNAVESREKGGARKSTDGGSGSGVIAGPHELGMGAIDGKNNKSEGGVAPEIAGRMEQKVKEVCFNCWSKGSGKTCTLHAGGAGGRGVVGGTMQGKAAGEARQAESALMCKNWNVGVMRRRYRSEELQVGRDAELT